MNKRALIALVLSPLLLTACDNRREKAIERIKDDEETIKKASAAVNEVIAELDRLRSRRSRSWPRPTRRSRRRTSRSPRPRPTDPERAQGAGGPRRQSLSLSEAGARWKPPLVAALVRELVALHDAPREVPPFSERHPGLTSEAAYAAARRPSRPPDRAGLDRPRTQDRLHQPEPLAALRRPRAGVGHGLRSDARLRGGRSRPRFPWRVSCSRGSSRRSASGSGPRPAAGRPRPCSRPSPGWPIRIEIVQCHHPGWKVTVADCTADNGLHGRLVVGAQVPIEEIDGLVDRLPALEVELAHDGRVVDRGVGRTCSAAPSNHSAIWSTCSPGRPTRRPSPRARSSPREC